MTDTVYPVANSVEMDRIKSILHSFRVMKVKSASYFNKCFYCLDDFIKHVNTVYPNLNP